MTKLAVAAIFAFSASSSLAGPIERSLGNNTAAVRTLESLAHADLNSPALESFIQGVKQLARNPDLSDLPSFQIGRKTVSLDGLAPLAEMLKKIGSQGSIPALNSSSGGMATPTNLQHSSGLSMESLSQFVSLESALEASPLPDPARADLLQMVRSVKEFATSK